MIAILTRNCKLSLQLLEVSPTPKLRPQGVFLDLFHGVFLKKSIFKLKTVAANFPWNNLLFIVLFYLKKSILFCIQSFEPHEREIFNVCNYTLIFRKSLIQMAIHGIFIANKSYKKRCWRYARYCSWVIECLFFSLCWFHNIWQEKKCWLVSIQLLVPSIIPPTNTSLFWISNFFLLFIQENMELRFETEQATKDCPRLKVSFLWLLFWSSDCWIVAFTVF